MYHFIALTLIPGVGPVNAKSLLGYCGSAEAVFKTKKRELLKIPGIGEAAAEAIIKKTPFERVD
ncbi:MAG: helix-hairpin-helix domain-containing protein, partial [Chitinophagales bacterium]